MGLGALAVIVTAGLAGGSILEQNRFNREMELLRATLQQARFSVDSCKLSVAQEEYRFLLFDEFVDSLHAEVRDMEDNGWKVELEALYWLGPDYMGNWVVEMLKNECERCNFDEEEE